MIIRRLVIALGIFTTLLSGVFSTSYDHTVLAQSSSKGNANTSNSTSITTPQTTNSLNNAVDKLNFTTAVGIMSSLQNDASGKPAWIVSGEWQMLLFKSHIELKKVQSALATFSTILTMVHLNGTALHQHSMSDFKLTSANSSNTNHYSSVTFNGTATITMKDGPHLNVPISIKIMNGHTISLWIDPIRVQNHFGSTLIYGIVLSQAG
jgi:hypothetical protein